MPAFNAQTTDPSMHPSQTKMEADPCNPDARDVFFDLLEISLNDFITLIGAQKQLLSVTARVNVVLIWGRTLCDTSDQLANIIWEHSTYCFT